MSTMLADRKMPNTGGWQDRHEMTVHRSKLRAGHDAGSEKEMSITDCPDCATRWSCSLEADGPAYVPCNLHKTTVTIYDPPSGWQYGFPKQYSPKPGETFADTLRRDGYPEDMISLGERHTRFWEQEI